MVENMSRMEKITNQQVTFVKDVNAEKMESGLEGKLLDITIIICDMI